MHIAKKRKKQNIDSVGVDDTNQKPAKRKQKLNNSKTEYDGIMFDSKVECVRYKQLKDLEAQGLISDLLLQKKYELIPNLYEEYTYYTPKKQIPHTKKRVVERGINYVADFVYKNKDGVEVVEDVKGFRNPASSFYAVFTLKRKMMLYHHNIRVSEITMLGLHERGMPRCPVCNGNKGYYSLKPIIEYYKKNKTLDGVEESKIYPTAYCVECLAPILLKDIIQQKKEEQG